MTDGGWIGDLPGIKEVQDVAVTYPQRGAVRFLGTGATVVDNPTLGTTDVTVDGGGTTTKPIAPVDAVQTAAFPGTYSAGTWTATATGALAAFVFDNHAVALGESVAFNTLGTLAVGNGVFIRVADTASKPTFTRRADANTGALLAGALFAVLQGDHRGRSQYVTNSGTITLDTTPVGVAEVRPTNPIVIDLTLPKYGLQFAPTRDTSTTPEGMHIVNQAIEDVYQAGGGANGVGGTVQLPMGWINPTSLTTANIPPVPLLRRPNVMIQASGFNQSGFATTGGFGGGWLALTSNLYVPPTFGPVVDTDSTAAVQVLDATNRNALFNITHAGATMTQLPAYVRRVMVQPIAASSGYLWNTRGQIQYNDPLTVCDNCVCQPDGSITATLRVCSATGVLALGAGPTLTISSGHLEVDHWLVVKITTAGARDTFKFAVSLNNGASWTTPILSAATNDIGALLGTFPLPHGLVFSWSNASAALTDSWCNYETRSVSTSASALALSVNQQVAAQWVPVSLGGDNKLHLLVSTADGAHTYGDRASVASTAFTLSGAVVNQKQEEEILVCSGMNARLAEYIYDGLPANVWLGSHSLYSNAPALTGTCPTTMPEDYGSANNIVHYWVPGRSGTPLTGPSGALYGWSSYIGNGSSFKGGGLMQWKREQGIDFAHNMSLADLSFDASATPAVGCVYEEGPCQGTTVKDVWCIGRDGYLWRDVNFYHHVHGLRVTSSRIGIGLTGGEIAFTGFTQINGSGIQLLAQGGADFAGRLWFAAFGRPLIGIAVLGGAITTDHMQEDDEGCTGYVHAFAVLDPGGDCHIIGATALTNSNNTPVLIGSNLGNTPYSIYWDSNIGMPGALLPSVFSIRDQTGQALRLGKNYSFIATDSVQPPTTDRAGKVVPFGGAPARRLLGALMTGNPALTFTASTKIVHRAAGSWLDPSGDGFAVGDTVTITGSASNNITGVITALAPFDMTLGGSTLVNEGPVSSVVVFATAQPLRLYEIAIAGGYLYRGAARFRMIASTIPAACTFTLPVSGIPEGFRVHVRTEIQGFNVTYVNGGPAAGTLDTVTAGNALSADYVLEMDAATLAVNWVRY